MLDQQRDVLAPFAERGHADREDAQTIEQVFAEAAGPDLELEVAIGRGDDADVDLDVLAPADAADGAFFEHAQQLDLERERHLADFVEEQRAAIGLFEDPEMTRGRAGEAAAFMSEQFGFDEF